jgi:isocitrate dehydrogenase kinase/phosphatase
MRETRSPVETSAKIVELVYELLDAHDDTARMADELGSADVRWAAHLDYLQRLQRVGREMLAASSD